MHISRVHIQNYKSLYDVEVRDLKPLSILVGPNDSGKSAILQALCVFTRAIGGGRSGAEASFAEVASHGFEGGPISIHVDLSLDEADRRDFLNAVLSGTDHTRTTDVEGKLRVFLAEWFMHSVTCEVVWYGEGQGPILERMWTPLPQTEQATLANVQDDRQSYFTVDLAKVADHLDNLYEILKTRPGVVGSHPLSGIENERFQLTTVPGWVTRRLSGRLAFCQGTRTVREESEVSFDRELDADGSNLLPVLWRLREYDPTSYERVREIARRLVPSSGDIGFLGEGKIASLAFKTEGVAHERLHNKGAGLEQLLVLATRAVLREGCIGLLEEPESHLHPGAQRQFLAWLRQLADRGWQFIISTHSPVLINEAGDSAAIVRVNKRDGRTSVSSWNQGPEGNKGEAVRLLAELGVQPSDVLRYNSLLLVEGASDCDVFRFLLERHAGDHRPLQVGITHYEGGRGKAVARYLGDKLSDALSPFADLRIIIVRDRGALAPDEIASLELLPNIRILERYELENYLLNPAGVAKYIGERCERDSPGKAELGHTDATEAKIEELLCEATTACAPLVCVKRSRDRMKALLQDLMSQLDKAQESACRTIVANDSISCIERWIEGVKGIAFQWETIIGEERETCTGEAQAPNVNCPQTALDQMPGSTILELVFGRFGPRYDKTRDAGALAKCMPPEHWKDSGDGVELRQIIQELMGESQEDNQATSAV